MYVLVAAALMGPAKCLDLDADLINADYALLYADYGEGDSTESGI
jgi:hypothetical protein